MSSSDYDEAERLFCGTWENIGNEMDEFMTAAGNNLFLLFFSFLYFVVQIYLFNLLICSFFCVFFFFFFCFFFFFLFFFFLFFFFFFFFFWGGGGWGVGGLAGFEAKRIWLSYFNLIVIVMRRLTDTP